MSTGVRVSYRCEGGAFRLKLLKALGRKQHLVVRNVQYTDDAVILARNSRQVQEELTLTDAQYGRLGLEKNTLKPVVQSKL